MKVTAVFFTDEKREAIEAAIESVTATTQCKGCKGSCVLSETKECSTMIIRKFAKELKGGKGE